MGALGAAALAWGCAGELDADPKSFTNAYTTATGSTTSTGGATATGGTVGMTGGATATGGTVGMTGGTAATGGTVSTGGSGTGTGGSAGVVPPDDSCVAGVLSAKGCISCHSNASANLIGAGLILEGADLGKRLVMTKATYKDVTINPTACVPGALIIDPVTPANSILLKKVSGTQVCGDKMPQGVGLSGADLMCLTDWINKF